MSFDQDPYEQANISGADLAIMVDEIKTLTKQRDELVAALRFAQKKIEDLHIEAGDGDCHYPIINDALDFVKGGA